MKTISIQQQFDILLIAAAAACTKLEAIAASKGWGFKTTSTEKVEEIKAAVKAVAVKRTKAVRVVNGRRPSRKAKTFPRFVGRLVTKVTPVRRPSVASKVAEVLVTSAKPIAAFNKAASKVQGWTKEVAALNAAYQDAVAAAKSAVAAL